MASVPPAVQWKEKLNALLPPAPSFTPQAQQSDDVPKLSAASSVAACRPTDWEKRSKAAGMSGLSDDAQAILRQFGGWEGLGNMAKVSLGLMAAPWLGALGGGGLGFLVGGPAGAAAGAAEGFELGTGFSIGAGSALLALGIKDINDKMRQSLRLFGQFLDMTRCDLTLNQEQYAKAAAVYREAAAAWFAGILETGLAVVGGRSLAKAYSGLAGAPAGAGGPRPLPEGFRRLSPGEVPENVIGEIDPQTGKAIIYPTAPPGENLPVPTQAAPGPQQPAPGPQQPAPLPSPPLALPPAPGGGGGGSSSAGTDVEVIQDETPPSEPVGHDNLTKSDSPEEYARLQWKYQYFDVDLRKSGPDSVSELARTIGTEDVAARWPPGVVRMRYDPYTGNIDPVGKAEGWRLDPDQRADAVQRVKDYKAARARRVADSSPSEPPPAGDGGHGPKAASAGKSSIPGKNFKEHWTKHKHLLEKLLDKKYPKWKVDQGQEFLDDLDQMMEKGELKYDQDYTLKKDTPPGERWTGNGLSLYRFASGEFWTLVETDTGIDSPGTRAPAEP
jgi:hypothetical protein